MVQIAFVTLLLGLTTGAQPVEVSVSGPVAAVELRLDGVAVGTLSGPPWKQRVSFGTALSPHELEARALAADGTELARARQWVNLPRPPAEVAIALEGPAGEAPTAARVTWRSLVAAAPIRQSLTLDGKPLTVDLKGRAALPRLAPDTPHMLSAEIAFGPGLEARRDVLLGAASEAFGELTAVPVRVRGGSDLPPPERLQGWFTAGGASVRAAAVEAAPRQVVIVREPAVREIFFRRLAGPAVRGTVTYAGAALAPGDRVRLLCATALRQVSGGVPADLFSPSRDFTAEDGGLDRLLTRTAFPEEFNASAQGQRLADAVAVAGLQAFAGNHPRAVVLVLSPRPFDASRYSPAEVRRYLAVLRVPLHVWSLGQATAPAVAAWGEVEDISTRPKLIQAIERLRADLESQRIVFLEGLNRPQAIALTPAAVGVELP